MSNQRPHEDGCTCFGCKVGSLGYQGHQSRGTTTRTVPVTADEGRNAGQVVGKHVQHWDGRQDAVVRSPTVTMKAQVQEVR